MLLFYSLWGSMKIKQELRLGPKEGIDFDENL